MKKIQLTGYVGADAEVKHNATTKENFVTFSVGTSVGTKDNPKTDWTDIVCDGKLMETAKNYVKKGTRVLIEGYPRAHAYVNKEGAAVGTLRVKAHVLELMGKAEKGEEPTDTGTDTSDDSGVGVN